MLNRRWKRTNAPRLKVGTRIRTHAAWPEPIIYAIATIAQLEQRSRNSVAEDLLFDLCQMIGIDPPEYQPQKKARIRRRGNHRA